MDEENHSARCPLCGIRVKGTDDEIRCYSRVLHLLDHAVREALGIDMDSVGDGDLRDLCDVDAGTDWLAAIGLARDCVQNGLGDELKAMYRFGATLVETGALGHMTRQEYAREFIWRQPARAVLGKLDEIAARLLSG